MCFEICREANWDVVNGYEASNVVVDGMLAEDQRGGEKLWFQNFTDGRGDVKSTDIL